MMSKPKDTRKGDRHSPGFMAAYMRRWRAKKKAESSSKPVDKAVNTDYLLGIETGRTK